MCFSKEKFGPSRLHAFGNVIIYTKSVRKNIE
ncbi:Bgt-51686 [Blumeria graminis f. sp. tritici]|uniref:Bgt-51686 n=1 Tax=Blumeria graminis f. sp. tritici TaxID=62690 RepID=A0A9X9MEE4_BLUGR|nr:Bgt-51686 [Blumeria graminis f. sp. tritici]